MSRRSKRLGLVLAGLAAGAALAEGVLRVTQSDLHFHFGTEAAHERDVTFRRGTIEHSGGATFTFDNDGFRGSSGLPYVKTVLFAGDSFTRGEGVQDSETFARVAEDQLRKAGTRARGLNAGGQGFGGAQELRLVRRMLDQFHPDAVILEVFPHNDLTDNQEDGGFGIENGKLVEYATPRRPWPARLRTALCSESPLRRSFLFRAAANAVVNQDWFEAPDTDAAFELERALLAETAETARRRHVPLAVLVVPAAGTASGNADPGDREASRFVRLLDIVRGLDVPFLDGRTVVPDADRDFIPNDGHFSVQGNEAIGRAVAELLRPLLVSEPASGREP